MFVGLTPALKSSKVSDSDASQRSKSGDRLEENVALEQPRPLSMNLLGQKGIMAGWSRETTVSTDTLPGDRSQANGMPSQALSPNLLGQKVSGFAVPSSVPIINQLHEALGAPKIDPQRIQGLTAGISESDKQAIRADANLIDLLSKKLEFEVYKAVMLNLGVAIIGSEEVLVLSVDEARDAERIIQLIQDEYNIDISSQAGIQAHQDALSFVYPQATVNQLTSKLTVARWEYQELAALERALKHFAPLLGEARESSSRQGIPQELESISKLDRAIDPYGNLQPSVRGRYLPDSRNICLFSSTSDFIADHSIHGYSSYENALEGITVHEITHALLSHEVAGYVDDLDYWQDEHKSCQLDAEEPTIECGKNKICPTDVEEPITELGKKDAYEDLSEAVAFYFVERGKLQADCPERYQLIEDIVKSWTPESEAAKP